VQLAAFLLEIVVESLDGGLHQPDPAVVTVESLIAEEGSDAVIVREIAFRGNDLEVRAFPECYARREIPDDE